MRDQAVEATRHSEHHGSGTGAIFPPHKHALAAGGGPGAWPGPPGYAMPHTLGGWTGDQCRRTPSSTGSRRPGGAVRRTASDAEPLEAHLKPLRPGRSSCQVHPQLRPSPPQSRQRKAEYPAGRPARANADSGRAHPDRWPADRKAIMAEAEGATLALPLPTRGRIPACEIIACRRAEHPPGKSRASATSRASAVAAMTART
jgi:hypothetical protein